MASLAIDEQDARAQQVNVTDEALTVDLVDGRTIIVPTVWYPRLWHGTSEERANFEIFGDGMYIHGQPARPGDDVAELAGFFRVLSTGICRYA